MTAEVSRAAARSDRSEVAVTVEPNGPDHAGDQLHTGSRRDVVVDGLRVAVFESGTGEPCVLLHGYPQSHWCWRHIIAPLAQSQRVVAVDWFGWGDSERSLRQRPKYEDEVARLGRLLDALGVARVNLFGHDYGGFIGLGFAVHQPQRVLRLAILDSRAHRTFPWLPYLQFGSMSWLACAPALFERLPLFALHRHSLHRYLANGSWTPADLERYIGWLRTSEGRRWLAHFYRHYRVTVRRALAEGCRAVTAPAAVIWGDQDPYCPFPIAEDLARRLPRARLVAVKGADHYVMEERPAEVVTALRILLAEPAQGPGS